MENKRIPYAEQIAQLLIVGVLIMTRIV